LQSKRRDASQCEALMCCLAWAIAVAAATRRATETGGARATTEFEFEPVSAEAEPSEAGWKHLRQHLNVSGNHDSLARCAHAAVVAAASVARVPSDFRDV